MNNVSTGEQISNGLLVKEEARVNIISEE